MTYRAGRNACTASSTFSSTVRGPKRFVIWNARASPIAARACGGCDETSHPNKRIRPAEGASSPVLRLNRVVLPAPFGPMIA